jgi:phage tail tape-measure protein
VEREKADGEVTVKATGAADANSDPLSRSPGAHPVGVGVGAAGGGAAGAAVGAVAGPVGAAVGAAVGAVAGGLAGKGVAEVVNPTVDRQHHQR